MKKLLVVRSGQTPWDISQGSQDDRRLQGTIPLPLTEAGLNDLKILAQEIAKHCSQILYSSGNESAGPTAEFLANQLNIKAKKIPDLHELDCGLWQGLRISDIKRRYCKTYKQWLTDPASVTPPQGESLDELIERINPALELMDRKSAGKTALLVTAPIIGAAIQCILQERPLQQLWQVSQQTQQLTVFDFEKQDKTAEIAVAIPAQNQSRTLLSSTAQEVTESQLARPRNKVI